MCSDYIENANSCYIDNWENIIDFLIVSFSMGLALAVLIGLVFLFIKRS